MVVVAVQALENLHELMHLKTPSTKNRHHVRVAEHRPELPQREDAVAILVRLFENLGKYPSRVSDSPCRLCGHAPLLVRAFPIQKRLQIVLKELLYQFGELFHVEELPHVDNSPQSHKKLNKAHLHVALV